MVGCQKFLIRRGYRAEGSPCHLLPDTSTLTDRKMKRSWQMPLAKLGDGYRMMSGVEEEEESSSGEEFYDNTYTISLANLIKCPIGLLA